jgi:pyruvate kinase, alpha/beta domain protein
MLETAKTIAETSGYAKKGDAIVITGGIPVNTSRSNVGSTNFLKVSVID